MPRATLVLVIMLLTTFLLNLAGYDSPITGFFSSTATSCSGDTFSLLGCLGKIAGAAAPAVIVGVSLISGNTAFAIAATVLILPLVSIPYEIFTLAGTPTQIKFVVGGFYTIMTAMAGIAMMRGDV